MSEMNKLEVTETENKSPEHEVLNPDQYKCNHVVAPENSCPWAIIQVYLGNQARRGDWDSPNEYIRLIPESTANSEGNLIYIEKCDKHGHWLPWQPTPEDIMACDWELVKSEACMLSFDMSSSVVAQAGVKLWGYLADDELASIDVPPFGTLTEIQNRTNIQEFSYFVWNATSMEIDIRVSSDNNQKGCQEMNELFQRDLTITVDEAPYHLGVGKDVSMVGKSEYEYTCYYNNSDALALGEIIKQVGQTKRFCLNWK